MKPILSLLIAAVMVTPAAGQDIADLVARVRDTAQLSVENYDAIKKLTTRVDALECTPSGIMLNPGETLVAAVPEFLFDSPIAQAPARRRMTRTVTRDFIGGGGGIEVDILSRDHINNSTHENHGTRARRRGPLRRLCFGGS